MKCNWVKSTLIVRLKRTVWKIVASKIRLLPKRLTIKFGLLDRLENTNWTAVRFMF